MMLKPIEMTRLHQQKPFWHSQQSEPILMSNLCLMRNVDKFKFVTKLEEKANQQLLKFISRAIQNHPNLNQVQIYSAEAISGDDKELLLERFMFTEGLNQAHHGQAFAMEASGSFLAVINFIEHLQLNFLNTGLCLESLLRQAVEIESLLSQTLEFAYNSRFGFLSANPKFCGTGLKVSALIHLPALIQTNQLQETLKSLPSDELSFYGLGPHQDYLAELLIVQNHKTIGLSEEKIISLIQSSAQRLAIAEMSCRKQLIEATPDFVLDKISRAYGLARYSYKIETKEAMQAMSLIKLGVHIGAISGLESTLALKLMFDMQRAHLKLYYDKNSLNDLDYLRAQSLHLALQGSKLMF